MGNMETVATTKLLSERVMREKQKDRDLPVRRESSSSEFASRNPRVMDGLRPFHASCPTLRVTISPKPMDLKNQAMAQKDVRFRRFGRAATLVSR